MQEKDKETKLTEMLADTLHLVYKYLEAQRQEENRKDDIKRNIFQIKKMLSKNKEV